MRNYNKYKKFMKRKKIISPLTITILLLTMMITLAVGYSIMSETHIIEGTANIGTFTIEYNLNGGDPLTNPIERYDATMGAPLPTPTKMNKVFGGWYEASDFSGSPINTTPTRK